MSNIIIYPGWGESFKEARYRKLAKTLENAGHKVTPMNLDWRKPLSSNVFAVPKSSIIVGFSYGAVIAYLIAQKFPYKKIILCSLSPLHKFSYKDNLKMYQEHMTYEQAKVMADDTQKIKINLKKLKVPYITLVGELEKGIGKADFIVPKTGHNMTNTYINSISKLL